MFDHFVGLQLKALTLSFLKRIAEFMLLDRFRERRKKDSRIHAFRSIQREREKETETEIERDRHRERQRETEQRYSSGSLLSLHFKCQKHLAPPVFELYYFYS